MDIIIEVGEYILVVWETNKAPEAGFCKWKLSCRHPEIPEYPETLWSSEPRYMTMDVALLEVVDAFYGEAGARRFLCLDCKGGTHHTVTSVDLDQDSTGIVVYLKCDCGKERTMEYKARVISQSDRMPTDRMPSDDERLTEHYEQQRRNRRHEEADTDG